MREIFSATSVSGSFLYRAIVELEPCRNWLIAIRDGDLKTENPLGRERTPGRQVVLRVRGSTDSLGKLTLLRECGVSWRYQRLRSKSPGRAGF